MASFTLKYNEQCGVYPKQASLPTNCSANVYCPLGITNAPTNQVYESTTRDQYLSHYLSTTLALNTPEKNTLIMKYGASNKNMNSLKTGQAISTVRSNWIGIIMPVHSTFPDQDISRSFYWDINIACHQSRSIVHTLPPQSNTGPKHKHRSL